MEQWIFWLQILLASEFFFLQSNYLFFIGFINVDYNLALKFWLKNKLIPLNCKQYSNLYERGGEISSDLLSLKRFFTLFHSLSNMQLDLGLFSPNPSWSLIVTWVLPLTPRTFQELPRLKKSASFSVFFISVRRFVSQSVAIWSLRSQNCSQNSNI